MIVNNFGNSWENSCIISSDPDENAKEKTRIFETIFKLFWLEINVTFSRNGWIIITKKLNYHKRKKWKLFVEEIFCLIFLKLLHRINESSVVKWQVKKILQVENLTGRCFFVWVPTFYSVPYFLLLIPLKLYISTREMWGEYQSKYSWNNRSGRQSGNLSDKLLITVSVVVLVVWNG